jgi:hypothetical protein
MARDAQRLLSWTFGDGASEVAVDGAPEGTIRYSLTFATFETADPAVVCDLWLSGEPEGLRPFRCQYRFASDPHPVAGEDSQWYAGTDTTGPLDPVAIDMRRAVAELDQVAVIRHWTDADGRRWRQAGTSPFAEPEDTPPWRFTRGMGGVITTEDVATVIGEYIERNGSRKGLARHVAEHFGLPARTAYRWINRAEQKETEA